MKKGGGCHGPLSPSPPLSLSLNSMISRSSSLSPPPSGNLHFRMSPITHPESLGPYASTLSPYHLAQIYCRFSSPNEIQIGRDPLGGRDKNSPKKYSEQATRSSETVIKTLMRILRVSDWSILGLMCWVG